MIVCDASGLIALIDMSEPAHEAAHAAIESEPGPFLLSPFVLAEVDYMLHRRHGVDEAIAFLDDVVKGVYRLVEVDAAHVDDAATVVRQYGDLGIGLADASIVVLAAAAETTRLLTLDERHFRAMRPLRGARSFTILPADAT